MTDQDQANQTDDQTVDEKDRTEKVEAALTAAREILKEAGADAVVIMAGIDSGPTIRTHIAISGPAYALAKLVFQGGARLAADIRKEAPMAVKMVEMECLEELVDDLDKRTSFAELMEAKSNGMVN